MRHTENDHMPLCGSDVYIAAPERSRYVSIGCAKPVISHYVYLNLGITFLNIIVYNQEEY